MCSRWPTEEERKARKAALLERISVFLDTPVSAEPGSWPKVSIENLTEIGDIYGEIADLKFERDCDGDQVLRLMAYDRSLGRYEGTFVPHSLSSEELKDPIKLLNYIRENDRAKSSLTEAASSIHSDYYHGLLEKLIGGKAETA